MWWLFEHLADSLVYRRQYEVWVAAAAGQPYFMVAGQLTRREALGAARRYAQTAPHVRVRVLDGRGAVVWG